MTASCRSKLSLLICLPALLSSMVCFAEGGESIDGEPLLTTLSIGGQQQLVTVLDIGNGKGIFEGDVLIPLKSEISGRSTSVQAQSASVMLEGDHWPDGILPYALDSSLSNTAREKILQAIEHWSSRTPIRIIPRTNETDYVNFINHSGCASYIGRIGGEQPIYSSSNCSMGNFVHEIGHALGLYHEHTRPDRNSFVSIHWDNISSGKSQNFDIVTRNIQVNTPYDYGSIMHYGSTFFTNNGQATITTVQPGVEIGQRVALSDKDIDGIKAIYSIGLRSDIRLSPERPMVGSAIKATLNLSNETGHSINTPNFRLSIPTGVTYLTASGSGWSCTQSDQQLDCAAQNMENGDSSELDLSMQAPSELSNSSARSQNLVFSSLLSATDDSGYEHSAEAQTTLTATTVNDKPLVNLDPLTTTMPILNENNIAQLSATDLNGHNIQNYTLISSDQAGLFNVDAQSGVISTPDPEALNEMSGQTLQMVVSVSDGVENSEPTTVMLDLIESSALNENQSGNESGAGGFAAGGGSTSAWWLLLLVAPWGRKLRPNKRLRLVPR